MRMITLRFTKMAMDAMETPFSNGKYTSGNTFSTVQRFIAMLDYGSDWGGVYFPIPHFFPIAASASVPHLQCHDSFREVRAI